MKFQTGNKNHRGVMGIEAALVLIAFVIVAAALSFVVLNMGFSSTQQAKETVTKGMAEASSALHISGEVVSATDIPRSKINATQFPIKIVSGGTGVNLNATLATVKFNTGSVQYDNILKKSCVLTSTIYTSMSAALAAAVTSTCISANPIGSPGNAPATTQAVVYWTVQKNTNEVVDPGEHANLVLVYNNADRPSVSTQINAELILDAGAPVEFTRTVPPLTDRYTNMG
ncbi:MAG: archaellin/type IV pilin N-terminal domain-containing protein, partial [Candidatus Nitrosotenuis sp.]